MIVAKGCCQIVKCVRASGAFLDMLVFFRHMEFIWTVKENKTGHMVSLK